MKNFIYQNYNLDVDKLYNNGKDNYFFIGENKIIIVRVVKKINDNLIDLSNEICKYYPISTFLLNKKNECVCRYKNDYIALLKINVINEKEIEITNLIELEKIKNKINVNKYLKKNNLSKKWEMEIDKYEREMKNYDKEYPKVKESLDYYLGIAENAVQMTKEIEMTYDYIGINCKIENLNVEELYNPLNYINVNKYYNYAKYLKFHFFYGNFEYEELHMIMENIKNEKNMCELFALLLYPDYYFELLESTIDCCKEKMIYNILNKRKKYEEMLLYVKKVAINNKIVQQIRWF